MALERVLAERLELLRSASRRSHENDDVMPT
jgi:hypothetical protein